MLSAFLGGGGGGATGFSTLALRANTLSDLSLVEEEEPLPNVDEEEEVEEDDPSRLELFPTSERRPGREAGKSDESSFFSSTCLVEEDDEEESLDGLAVEVENVVEEARSQSGREDSRTAAGLDSSLDLLTAAGLEEEVEAEKSSFLLGLSLDDLSQAGVSSSSVAALASAALLPNVDLDVVVEEEEEELERLEEVAAVAVELVLSSLFELRPRRRGPPISTLEGGNLESEEEEEEEEMVELVEEFLGEKEEEAVVEEADEDELLEEVESSQLGVGSGLSAESQLGMLVVEEEEEEEEPVVDEVGLMVSATFSSAGGLVVGFELALVGDDTVDFAAGLVVVDLLLPDLSQAGVSSSSSTGLETAAGLEAAVVDEDLAALVEEEEEEEEEEEVGPRNQSGREESLTAGGLLSSFALVAEEAAGLEGDVVVVSFLVDLLESDFSQDGVPSSSSTAAGFVTAAGLEAAVVEDFVEEDDAAASESVDLLCGLVEYKSLTAAGFLLYPKKSSTS